MTFKATYRTRAYSTRSGRTRRTNPVPNMRYERALVEGGAGLIAGVDEVGLGAWAGPLAVGMVVFEPSKRIYKLRDSKLVDPARRRWLSERVKQACLCWSIGMSWPDEIDAVGLSEAQRRAARRALEGLTTKPDAFLLDGNWNFVGEKESTTTIVRGDCESVSIAGASIVAKVVRDQLMSDLAGLYPFYRFDSNKGYPSPQHRWALSAVGPSPLHRRLFAPVQKLIDEGIPGRLLPATLQ